MAIESSVGSGSFVMGTVENTHPHSVDYPIDYSMDYPMD